MGVWSFQSCSVYEILLFDSNMFYFGDGLKYPSLGNLKIDLVYGKYKLWNMT